MLSPHVTLIIKVTNACNMRCRYCFIEPSVFHKTMSDETARLIVRAFLDSAHFESVQFVWHGGEPLLRGRAFYERVFAEQRSRPTAVAYGNATQTNATHLDDEMLELLLANGVSIGLSLDGAADVNNASRAGRRKIPLRMAGSSPVDDPHATTVDAARRLQARGIAPAAIVTVNRNNVEAARGIYREFTDRRIHMKVNPLTRSGLADTALGADLGITPHQYGSFLVQLFDCWFDDRAPVITVEPIGQHIARILGVETTHSCFYTKSCHKYFLGISPDGDLFPCGMFQGEPAFRYGNIHELSPEDVAGTVLFGRLEAREEKVLRDCSRCAFLDLCYSGCMFHSLKDAHLLDEKDYYCAGYRMYFEHALRRIHAEPLRATALLSSSSR